MHLTDDQLNEYLDNQSNERAQIESHLASCAECAARLTALQALFAELESLPELEPTRNFAARFVSAGKLNPQLPRWLPLTAGLQAALALLALIAAAPFVMKLIPPIKTPSLAELLIQIQTQWLMLFDTFTNVQLPTLTSLPPLDLSTVTLSFALAGASLLWLVGNGLLLRRQIK